MRRARRRRTLAASVMAAAAVAVVGGSWWGVSAVGNGGRSVAPVPPATGVPDACDTRAATYDVVVYLQDDITKDELSQLSAEISGESSVEDITYVSKDEAFDEFRERYRDQPEFWENLPHDALPASLRIDLWDAADAEFLEREFSLKAGVEVIFFGTQMRSRERSADDQPCLEGS